jgi:hypothetical protein
MNTKQIIYKEGLKIIDQLLLRSSYPKSIQVTIHDYEYGLITKTFVTEKFKDGSRGESEMAPPEITVYCISCGDVQTVPNNDICEDCTKDGKYPGDIYGY